MITPTMTSHPQTVHKPGTSDGWHGVIPSDQFPAEKGRYHLYFGLFCPFAHRANFIRHLKGLTEFIDVSILRPFPKGDDNGWPGWCFPKSNDEYPGATVDQLFGEDYLHKIYFRDDPEYKGKYAVPVLWDKKMGKIVSTESAELLRWLPTAFNSLLPPQLASIDLYPEPLRETIDKMSPWIQSDLNTGVYHAGLASTQEDYDKAIIPVFGALNKLEKIIAQHGGPFILGSNMTEVDVRVYTTLIRFDPVYVEHFKCNLGTVRHDYPVLHHWLKVMYWDVPAGRASTDFMHIKDNYYKCDVKINPSGITPMGPYHGIEEGVERDWKALRVGGIQHPAVLEHEASIPDV